VLAGFVLCGCAANRLLPELRYLLDSAYLSFLGMLPTFTGFSHGVNQSSEGKKASLLPALFPFVLLNFEAQANCNQLQRRLTTDLDAAPRMDYRGRAGRDPTSVQSDFMGKVIVN